jgi:hypothetical protein
MVVFCARKGCRWASRRWAAAFGAAICAWNARGLERGIGHYAGDPRSGILTPPASQVRTSGASQVFNLKNTLAVAAPTFRPPSNSLRPAASRIDPTSQCSVLPVR